MRQDAPLERDFPSDRNESFKDLYEAGHSISEYPLITSARKSRFWSDILPCSTMDVHNWPLIHPEERCYGIPLPPATFCFGKCTPRYFQNTGSQVCQDWYLSKYNIITRNCLQSYNNLETINQYPNLMYFVTTMKRSHHFCSLLPCSAAMLFTKRRKNKLRMCTPL